MVGRVENCRVGGLSGLRRGSGVYAAGRGTLPARGVDRRAGPAACRWPGGVGDMVYGHSGQLRSWLEDRDWAYLLAVPAHATFRASRDVHVVRDVYAALAEGDWQWLSTGPGSKGERGYDWQFLVLAEGADADKGHYLRFRRGTAGGLAGLSCVGLPSLRRAHPGPGSQAAAGTSSRSLRWPSRKWAWTSTRCAALAGTATWSWPCER